MKMTNLLLPCLITVFCTTLSAHAGQEVDRLLAEYGKIKTVTCQIRRTKEGSLGKMKFLSRVYWTSKNQIHAEGITPLKRRIIADGQRLWEYVEGDPKGFSRPIDKLSKQMAISLEMVPGSAMDQLLRLKGLDETELPTENGSPKRIGLQAPKQYVVMLIDEAGRLTGLRFYKTSAMKALTSKYDYSDFVEAVPGAWIPLTHEASIHNGKTDYQETVKVDRFIANKPVAKSLFIASSFFAPKIDFVDDFAKIFP